MGALAAWSPVHGTAYVNLRKAMTQAVATKQNTSWTNTIHPMQTSASDLMHALLVNI